jgi:acyl carrier protein
MTVRITLKDFLGVKATLRDSLINRLEEEILMDGDMQFEPQNDDEASLFTTPIVDSKTVMKLSPAVEAMTGKKIKPEWIKKGGYESVDDAIAHLLKQLELDFSEKEGN